ncbi:lymphocyte antigen 6B-like [Periophthalmus magnuspinnatus]|uniref:lymphocyte antigen 6B-like n=1 Tax=Periophthalmus magnuspinnatus TaxID=409849 RepID=UPI00145A0693|nr:lymphocyte antigen 6B-like [Periophthalmus magnuspinnatus]
MAKILIGIVAVLACFVMAESLDCNKCIASLFGFCFGSDNVTCAANQTCYTATATFPSVSSFRGISQQGCIINTTCTNGSDVRNGSLPVIGTTYTVNTMCCNTDRCNPVNTSGATSVTMSLSVLSVAALCAMWGSYM